MTLVNSVDTGGAVLEVLVARKKPFLLRVVARTGVTEVAAFTLERFDTLIAATGAMYDAFGAINRNIDGHAAIPGDNRIRRIMDIAKSLYGDCAFSVTVHSTSNGE